MGNDTMAGFLDEEIAKANALADKARFLAEEWQTREHEQRALKIQALAALRAILDAYIDETTRANNGVPVMSARISQARAALRKAGY